MADEFRLFEKRKGQSEEYRKGLEPNWTELAELYHLIYTKWSSRLFIPMLKPYAKSLQVRWMSGIFTGTNFFSLTGVESSDDQNARNMENLINFQAVKEMKLRQKMSRMFRSLSYLGNQVGCVLWDSVKQTNQYKTISLWDSFPDPAGDSMETCEWFITREAIPYSRLLELQKIGILENVERVKEFPYGEGEKTGQERAAEFQKTKVQFTGNDGENKDYPILIYEMWTDEQVITLEPKSKTILRKEPNPFSHKRKPFVLFRPQPEDGVFYGLPPVIDVKDLQKDLIDVRHYRKRLSSLALRGIWFGRRGSGIDWERLATNGIILGDDPNSVKQYPVNANNMLGMEEENQIKSDGDRALNIFDPQRGGGEGDVTKTVGGLSLLIKEGNLIFAEDIANIQTDGIVPMVEMLISNNQQFLPDNKRIRVLGTSTETTLTKQNLSGKLDVVVGSSPGLGMREMEQVAMAEVWDKFIAKAPQTPPDPEVDTRKLKEDFLRLYNQDPARLLFPANQRDIIAENQQLQEQVQMTTQAYDQLKAEYEQHLATMEANARNEKLVQEEQKALTEEKYV